MEAFKLFQIKKDSRKIQMDEEKACKEFEKFTVCVPIEEDLGKKRILVIFSNDEEKWFEKTEDFMKHLRKRGIPKNQRFKALTFVNAQLRSITKHAKGIKVDRFERSENKEI